MMYIFHCSIRNRADALRAGVFMRTERPAGMTSTCLVWHYFGHSGFLVAIFNHFG